MKAESPSNRVLSVLAATFVLVCVAAPLQGREFAKLGDRVWDGKVAITRLGHSQLHIDESQGGNTYIRKERRDVSDTTTISACGTDILLSVYSVSRKLTDRQSKSLLSIAAEADCGLVPNSNRWKNERLKLRPGDRREEQETRNVSLYRDKDSPPLEQATSVTLRVAPGGDYELSVAHRALVAVTEEQFEESQNRCNGTTKRSELHMTTGKLGEPPTFSMEPPGTGKNRETVIRQSLPPLQLPTGFAAQDTGTENLVRGMKLIGETKSSAKGGYNEVENGSWSFRIKDLCREVHDQLVQDLAFAEAYLDPALHMLASSYPSSGRIAEYGSLVNIRAYRILHGKDPSSGSDDYTQTDAAATQEYCKGGGREQLKEKYKRACRPEVLYDSLVVHEDMHCRQIQLSRQDGGFGAGQDATVWGLQEVNAYLAGIDVLMNWLEEHCPQYDLVTEKQKVAEIRRLKASH